MPETCAAIVIAAKHGELIKVKDYSGITDTVGALRCKFEFRTDDWNNATMTAVFCKGNVATQPSIVNTAIGVLLDGVNECAVPAEVLTRDAKYFSVGIWGVTASGLRIVSKWLVFRIEDGCYVDATEPIEPTPTVYEQIMMALQSKAPVDHKHNDIYYTKEEIDSMELGIDDNILQQIASNTEARHTHSNKNALDKFSEDNNGNPLYNGKKIVADVDFKETDPTVPTWAKQPNKPTYTASEVGAESAGTASIKIAEHNTNEQAHRDIRLLIASLSERINAVADSDDTTLDQLSEIVAYIKSNKTLIDAITTEKISYSDIINNLETNVSNKPLSASMGVALKSLIDAIVVPTRLSELSDDMGYAKMQDVPNSATVEGLTLKAQRVNENSIIDLFSVDLPSGVTGKDGLSAYQIWLNEGNTGTEVDFLASLKGETGADGKVPIKGTDYFTESDKAELVSDVIASLPVWLGGEY